jgi:hypothetical protein
LGRRVSQPLFPADLVIGDLHAELVEIDENFKFRCRKS